MAIENRSQQEIRASYKNKTFDEVFKPGLSTPQQHARVEQLFADAQSMMKTLDGFATLMSKYATALQMAEVALDTGAVNDREAQELFQQAGGQFYNILGYLKKHGHFQHFVELAVNTAIDKATEAAANGDVAARTALKNFSHDLDEILSRAAKGNPIAKQLKDQMDKGGTATFMGIRFPSGGRN